ncbi:MAG: hypothetical protein AAGI53_17375 [Planctomycetota bacterium]
MTTNPSVHLLTLGSIACIVSAGRQTVVEIPLFGSDGDGYLAIVGFNQEGNQSLSGIVRDPGDAKFFDYPAYVNPSVPANIYIMAVEPYRFGLDYPDPLHPAGLTTFQSVGSLAPASAAGDPGVTFIEAVSEDADFGDTNLGTLSFDGSTLTGVGTELVGPAELIFTINADDFEATNRAELLSGSDAPPFGPSGRSNRNEFANQVTIEISNASGLGLMFEDGVLVSADLIADASVSVLGAAFGSNPTLTFDAIGTLTLSGSTFVFDIDGVDSLPFASNVRLLLTRTGTIDAIGAFVLPGSCDADFDGDGFVTPADVQAVISEVTAGVPAGDVNSDGTTDFFDVVTFLRIFDEGCIGA